MSGNRLVSPRGVWLAAALVVCAGLLLAGCAQPPTATARAVKIEVAADGLYEVTAAALREAGFDLAAQPALTLTVGGEPVAFEVVGRGRNTALRFYGQARGRDAYTPTNVYWLAAGTTPPPPIETREGAPLPALTPTTVVSDTVTFEEDRVYHGQGGTGAAGEALWFWETLFAPVTVERTLAVADPAAGAGRVQIFLHANSSAGVNPDHRLRVLLNGVELADATWDGLGAYVLAADVPPGVLTAGDNTLTITAPGDTGAPADVLLLDRIELSYPRALVLRTGLTLTSAARSLAVRLPDAAGSRGADAALWDVTEPSRPVIITGAAVVDGSLHFSSDGAPRRFSAVAPRGFRAPAAITAVATTSLPDFAGGADMIIVTAPALRESLAPLIAARQAQGLRVAVFDVDEVADAFAGGRAGPESIRTLVRHALVGWPAPAPRYLLLAGDASYDPQDRLAGSERDLVPTRLVHTTFSGWSASDVWFALPDDTPAARPGLAVGRLPAQTPEQMAAMIRKTLAYEQAADDLAWRKTALIVADNDEVGFTREADEFAAALTGFGSQVVTIEEEGDSVRSQLQDGFAQGSGLVGYFGHGSVTLWAKEKILETSDAAGMTNASRLPVVFTVTCLTGYFEHPKTPSLAEALLRNPQGGAVAALVPSSAAVLADQRLLAVALAEALGRGAEGAPRRLGDIVRAAQSAVPEGGPGVEDILLTFNLLGDPALQTVF